MATKLYRVRASFFDATNQIRVQAWHVWATSRKQAVEQIDNTITRYCVANGFRDKQIYGVNVVPRIELKAPPRRRRA